MNHKGTINIVTERLLLRRYVKEDALPMFKNWANDTDVTNYLTWEPHENVEVTKNILNMWIEDYKSPENYNWGIVLKEYGKVIGSIAVVNHTDQHSKCEIGYCLSKSYWGKGIMTEALKAVIDYLIKKVEYNRVEAYHHSENLGSGRVMEKAGLKYEGHMRDYAINSSGVPTDCEMYAVIRGDLD